MNNLYTEKVLSALKNADNFMICAHIYPDGDAIGSLLALGRLLDKLGKTVTLVSADGVPRDLLWMCRMKSAWARRRNCSLPRRRRC